ncbi:MAG: penicillin-binding transpeptidase domain-containing protein [Mycoplasmatales bacterium]
MINKKIKIFKNIIIILFIILIGKFLMVTLYYSEDFTNLASSQTNITLENPMPRGEIFDRNNKLVVGNKEQKNLVYLGSDDIDNEQEWEITKELTQNIDVSKNSTTLNEDDYKDLIIRENYEEIMTRVNQNSVKYKDLELEDALRDEVTQADYDKLAQEYGQEEIKLKILMDASSESYAKVLVENLTEKEQYFLRANFGKLGGCFIVSDWERYYPYQQSLRTILGSVGDIPEEEVDKYESLGYSSSDQVGISYIEKEQEMYLKSTPQKYQIYYDDAGNITNYKIIQTGTAGKDLKLTIDIELQKDIEKILQNRLEEDAYQYFKTDYSSIVDVQTGELLAIAGKYEDDEKYYDVTINNFTTAYEVGSIVKPAVLLMGYYKDTWEWGQQVYDTPMQIGTVTKGSYHNYGTIDENRAIGVSSNVYFYQVLLKLAGINYAQGDTIPGTIDKEYFDLVRGEFAKFGLGVKTGIDFDNEIEGVKSTDQGAGLYVDLANGQYDTYTPLQVTQYAATLANGKNRMKVNYLYSVNEPGGIGKIGNEINRVSPQVLNVLDEDTKDIKHVQDTLIKPSTISGGTTGQIADSRYDFGSKSGTSESFYKDETMKEAVKTDNSSFIGYAPYTNPQIAVSVFLPYWTKDGEVTKASAVETGGEVLDACYEHGYIKN